MVSQRLHGMDEDEAEAEPVDTRADVYARAGWTMASAAMMSTAAM